MKQGAENRRKTIIAGALGAVALICIVYAYNMLFGGPDTAAPPPAVATSSKTATPMAAVAARTATASDTSGSNGGAKLGGSGVAAGVAATKLASTSASLDPTLDESAMLRTEGLVYTGTGRNIFSATYTPPPTAIPAAKFAARPSAGPVLPPGPPPIPPLPPINLKFFGTAKRSNGVLQAFLLSGEDVYIAAPGDIVARKYKIVSITATSIRITDLQNNNTQSMTVTTN